MRERFFVIPSSSNIKKWKSSDYAWVEACQKFDFSLQKSLLLCNINSNDFHYKNMTFANFS